MRRTVILGVLILALLIIGGGVLATSLGTPERPDAVVVLGSRDTTSEHAQPDDGSVLERVAAMLDSADVQGARSLLEPHIKSRPGDADAVVLLARCYMEEGDPAQASVLVKQAVDAHPENADYRYWYATSMGQEAMTANTIAQMSLGMKAMEQYNRAIEIDPDHVESRKALMFAALFAPSFIGGGEERARMHAQEIARVDPREGKLARAQFAARDEDYAQAVKLMDEALAMEGPALDRRVMVQYVRTLHDAGETERAFDAARSLIERGDEGREGLYQLGRLSALSGEYPQEGERSLRHYLTLERTEIPEAYVRWRMAQILIKDNRLGEARSELERALELEPGMEEATDTLRSIEGG